MTGNSNKAPVAQEPTTTLPLTSSPAAYTGLFGLFPRLPTYSGPFKVGSHDIEFKRPGGQPISPESEGSSKDVDTLLVRMYYPIADSSTHSHHHHHAKHHHWLPRPLSIYSAGYGDFVRAPRWASVPVVISTLARTKTQAFQDVPLVPAPEKLPVAIFSHGLGGNRSTYSQICGEMASTGVIVCAIEHRDGSAAISAVQTPREGHHHHHHEPITYMRPPEPMKEAMAMRFKQIGHRLKEVALAVHLLHRLNDGTPIDNLFESDGSSSSTNVSTQQGNLVRTSFAQRLDLENNFLMTGHSFGGGTAFQALLTEQPSTETELEVKPTTASSSSTTTTAAAGSAEEQTSEQHQDTGSSSASTLEPSATTRPKFPFHAGILLDPWYGPLEHAGDDLPKVPMLSINSEQFGAEKWPDHFEFMKKKVLEADKGEGNSFVAEIKGTTHDNQSDIPSLFPNINAWTTAPKNIKRIPPLLATELNKSLINAFIAKTLPTSQVANAISRKDANMLQTGNPDLPPQIQLYTL